ncbi:hypothetical protein MQK27_18360, partial [Vibrio cholerae]|nr:hypothetical protein [Vibrio cholerae]
FLEMLALWQGYVRNKDLVDQFSITRQQAYQDIRAYQEQHPERHRFLEMLALWQGYVRNKDLVDQFSITRQQAYQDIRAYQEQ